MREPEHSRRHRTIARVALPLVVVWALAGTAQARVGETEKGGAPDRIVFPVVGHASYENDFGDPRGQGSHEGNDILADWRAPVVATEAGTVRLYTGSSRAGCMLYLHGRSGATYLYIHLNNDLGPKNDNKGPCKQGIAYAPGLRDGQTVRAGQLVGFVGNSGDADAAPYHLHFELHPGDGAAVSPYRWLRRAEKLLFAAPEGELARAAADATTLTLIGTVVEVAPAAQSEDAPPAEPDTTPAEPQPTGADATPAGPGETGPGLPGVPAVAEPANGAAPPPPPPSGRRGTPADGALLTIRVTSVRLSTGEKWSVTRAVTLTVPASAVFERALPGKKGNLGLEDLSAGDKITVTTAPVELSLQAQRARPGALAAARILLH